MKMIRIVYKIAVALTFLIPQAVIANAAEIKVWTARALATVLAEIGPQFERTKGHNLNVYSGLPADFELGIVVMTQILTTPGVHSHRRYSPTSCLLRELASTLERRRRPGT